MDCPSEEQLIRMKLADMPEIHALEFDIPQRKLIVFHSGNEQAIFQQLNDLKLDTSFIESMGVSQIQAKDSPAQQDRKLLWQVLAINALFFVFELITGFVSHSMGLVADSLDMLADSIVYGMALWAVGRSMVHKKNIARYAGYLQLILALLGFTEVIRRFWGMGEIPDYQTMVTVSALALIANALCLYLLQKSKSKEVHIRASMIFTSSDVMVNLGVMIAAGLVYLLNSRYPDIVVGSIVFIIVGLGALKILKLSR
jgi:Co/Zn/Cd efflux system component